MNDPRRASNLDMLRFLERVQLRDLERTRKWIAEAERREAELRHGEEHRPPVPDWVIDVGIGQDRHPVAVHVGGCHMAGHRVRPLGRDQAVRALTDGGVEPCSHCRPDTELGVLD